MRQPQPLHAPDAGGLAAGQLSSGGQALLDYLAPAQAAQRAYPQQAAGSSNPFLAPAPGAYGAGPGAAGTHGLAQQFGALGISPAPQQQPLHGIFHQQQQQQQQQQYPLAVPATSAGTYAQPAADPFGMAPPQFGGPPAPDAAPGPTAAATSSAPLPPLARGHGRAWSIGSGSSHLPAEPASQQPRGPAPPDLATPDRPPLPRQHSRTPSWQLLLPQPGGAGQAGQQHERTLSWGSGTSDYTPSAVRSRPATPGGAGAAAAAAAAAAAEPPPAAPLRAPSPVPGSKLLLRAELGLGLEVFGCFVGRLPLGYLQYRLELINHSDRRLDGFMLQLDRNSAGLAPSRPEVALMALEPGSSARVDVPLVVRPERAAPRVGGELSVALRTNQTGTLFFRDWVPTHLLE
jgi:hypothetical protein